MTDSPDVPLDWDEFITDLDTTLQDVSSFNAVMMNDPTEGFEEQMFVEQFKDYLSAHIGSIFIHKIDGEYRYVVECEDAVDFVTFMCNGSYLNRIQILVNAECRDTATLLVEQFFLSGNARLQLGTFFYNEIRPRVEAHHMIALMSYMKTNK